MFDVVKTSCLTLCFDLKDVLPIIFASSILSLVNDSRILPDTFCLLFYDRDGLEFSDDEHDVLTDWF